MENTEASEIIDEVAERSKGGKRPESSKLLSSGIKSWWVLLLRPIEDYLIKEGYHPNVLTITTLIVSGITGYFFHLGWFFVAGVFLFAGSTFDVFDGRVARAQGLSSESGAFFDSCIDRYSEALIYLGLLSYFRDSYFIYLIYLILSTSMMVSYTRARAEGLGIKCEVGIMQRTERVVYLGLFSVFNIVGNKISYSMGIGTGDYLIKIAIILLFGFSLYTSIQRMQHVLNELKTK
ncbi:MAG: hypothetical protein GTO02_06585 [Candidatus Dadabacteria bacterium]|nr:hypothetical protein [Candidatus Dadabacteria bacterium]NIQ14068.1 hypothetical protein [Candidatus Dadabacteria bacterium]